MAQVFFDDIESGGLTNFTATDVVGASASIAAATGAVKNGVYGISASTVNAVNSNDHAIVYKTFTANANLVTYLNFWFQFNTHSTVGFGSATAKGIARLGNDVVNGTVDATARAFALIFPTTTYQLQGSYRSASGTDTLFGSAVSFTPATWYAIRMMLDQSGTNPICTWWSSTDGVNYTQQATVTDSSSGSNGTRSTINFARVGAVHNGSSEPTSGTYYFDDFEIRDDIAGAGSVVPESPLFFQQANAVYRM